MIPLEILRPVYTEADNSLNENLSQKITIFVDWFKPHTQIRNTDNGTTYTTLKVVIPPDQDIRQTDLIAWPQGLTEAEFATKGRWLSVLSWYLPKDANGNIHHIEVTA
ncbi:hypothetical protein [Leptospira interrogans]|uniref:hypothetical protein n=1 Tax=Leptospira interrogans TaxID=173 RepID=UPI0002BB27CE|nr:hypothetical protein [Leptospira interrogans]EMO00851.1 hypothetical protein LEP1GSC112_0462 [Leptospira interrogans serovar Pomona str. UT364]MBM2890036.1 hypothetical protein [Leptospira interrogans]QOI36744.1 hypothetical protein LeptoLang_21350 [Leptospira interrogans serovar Icterohaemorrhagiae]